MPVGNAMKEFLKTNTVTHNLMAFTGFRSILIFTSLVEGPKTYKQLQEILKKHPYLNESVSIDALRIYINSLEEMGCKVIRHKKGRISTFSIEDHPFTLKFTKGQIESLIKVYKAISKSIEVDDLISLQEFFNKISGYIKNENLKNRLQNVSPLNNIDKTLLFDLMKYANNNTEIVIFYNSSASYKKNITIAVDRLFISNGKLYVAGFNSEYQTYSSFLVSKIIKIVGVNLVNKTLDIPYLKVGYKYENISGEAFEFLEGEKLVKKEGNDYYIEYTSRNKFDIMQRVLSLSSKCTVLYPQDFRQYIITTLKKMKEAYVEK